MARRKLRGTLIALEGIDGSGKSTAVRTVIEVLRRMVHPRNVVLTKEPGGWTGGEYIRNLLLDSRISMDPVTEFLLFLADRSGHVEEVIRPALAEGSIVLTERFSSSSYAYQGGGLEVPVNFIADGHDLLARMRTAMTQNSSIELHSDLTIWFAIPPEEAYKRLISRDISKDRIETRGVPFLAHVNKVYFDMYRHDSSWQKINALNSPDEVAEDLWTILATHLNLRSKEHFFPLTWTEAKERADVE